MQRSNKEMFVGEPLSKEEAAAIAEINAASSGDESQVIDPLETIIYNGILSELERGSIKPSEAFDDIVATRINE